MPRQRRAARAAAVCVMTVLVAVGACRQHAQPLAPADATFATAIAGSDWSLLELDGRPVPGGAGGKRPTIRFDAAAGRATGFTGCNEFRAGYIVAHDTLRFEPPDLTRMACAVGMDLERRFLAALGGTQRYRLASGDLLLLGVAGTAARFTKGGN